MLIHQYLYRGDNGTTQEFWQSETHELLILRLHNERCWTAHRNCQYLGCADSPEDVISELHLNAQLSPDYIWAKDVRGAFQLVAATKPTATQANE